MADLPLSGETRHCATCKRDMPVEIWNEVRQDHPVVVSGPMEFDRIGVTETSLVHYRVHEPFITVWCSELDSTLAALQPTFEEERC